jgi:hypothetical protein
MATQERLVQLCTASRSTAVQSSLYRDTRRPVLSATRGPNSGTLSSVMAAVAKLLQCRKQEEIGHWKWFFFKKVINNTVLMIKPTRCTNFSNLFLEQNSTCFSSSVHHQQSSAVHTAIHTGYADCLLAGSTSSILIPLASSQHKLYVHVLLCVQR